MGPRGNMRSLLHLLFRRMHCTWYHALFNQAVAPVPNEVVANNFWDDFFDPDDVGPAQPNFAETYVYKVSSAGGARHNTVRAAWVQEGIRCLFPAAFIDGVEATVAWPTDGETLEILPSFHVVLCRNIRFIGAAEDESFMICTCRSPTGKEGASCRSTMEEIISYGWDSTDLYRLTFERAVDTLRSVLPPAVLPHAPRMFPMSTISTAALRYRVRAALFARSWPCASPGAH